MPDIIPANQSQNQAQSKPIEEPEIFVMPRGAPPPKVTRPPLKVKFGKSVYLIVGGVIFIVVLAGVGYWVTSSVSNKVPAPVVVTPPPPTPTTETPVLPSETTPTTTPETTVACTIVRSGVDSDSDGLTDVEEGDIYHSNTYSPDTDGDKFLDGNEVFHLYSPIAPTPATLTDSGLVKTYQNQEFGYNLWYPATWTAVSKDAENREINFVAPTSEAVIVTAIFNPNNLSLQDWYMANIPNARAEEIKPLETKGGKSGIQSEDRLTAYFSKDGNILEIKYNLGNQCAIEYRSTFGIIVRSFVY